MENMVVLVARGRFFHKSQLNIMDFTEPGLLKNFSLPAAPQASLELTFSCFHLLQIYLQPTNHCVTVWMGLYICSTFPPRTYMTPLPIDCHNKKWGRLGSETETRPLATLSALSPCAGLSANRSIPIARVKLPHRLSIFSHYSKYVTLPMYRW